MPLIAEQAVETFYDLCMAKFQKTPLETVQHAYRGGLLVAYQCVRWTTVAEGHVGERQPHLTGGVELTGLPPIPLYGASKPYSSRVRPPWQPEQLRARIATMVRKLDETIALDIERDKVYAARSAFLSASGEELVQRDFYIDELVLNHKLPYDCADMTAKDCRDWLAWLASYSSETSSETSTAQ